MILILLHDEDEKDEYANHFLPTPFAPQITRKPPPPQIEKKTNKEQS